MNRMIIAFALAIGPLAVGCDETAEEERIDEAAEAAEETAEAHAAEQGYGPVDQQLQGEIAERRAELAGAIGEDPAAQNTDGRTTAQRLDDIEAAGGPMADAVDDAENIGEGEEDPAADED